MCHLCGGSHTAYASCHDVYEQRRRDEADLLARLDNAPPPAPRKLPTGPTGRVSQRYNPRTGRYDLVPETWEERRAERAK